jgi:hypothetical protein
MDDRKREVRGLSLGGGRGRLRDYLSRGLMKESLCEETTGMNVSVSSTYQLKPTLMFEDSLLVVVMLFLPQPCPDF